MSGDGDGLSGLAQGGGGLPHAPQAREVDPDLLPSLRRRALLQSGLGADYWRWSLECGSSGPPLRFWQAAARARLRRWVLGSGGALYLSGTEERRALVAAAAMDCLWKDPLEAARYLTLGHLDQLARTRRLADRRPEDRLEAFANAQVLVIEDLGGRSLSEFLRDVLLDVLRWRLERRTPWKTLLSGRPPPRELERWLRGERSAGPGAELVALWRESVTEWAAVVSPSRLMLGRAGESQQQGDAGDEFPMGGLLAQGGSDGRAE